MGTEGEEGSTRRKGIGFWKMSAAGRVFVELGEHQLVEDTLAISSQPILRIPVAQFRIGPERGIPDRARRNAVMVENLGDVDTLGDVLHKGLPFSCRVRHDHLLPLRPGRLRRFPLGREPLGREPRADPCAAVRPAGCRVVDEIASTIAICSRSAC